MLKESKSYFENLAKEWVDDAYSTSRKILPIGEQRKELVLNIVNKFSPKSLNILDIGSGGGQITKALLASGHQVTATDRSEKMLTLLDTECSTLHAHQYANLKKIHSCATTLNEKLAGNKYDVIICIGMIYYLEDDSIIYKIMKDNLKTDGTAIITYRNKLFNLFPNSKKMDDNKDTLYQIYHDTKSFPSNIDTQKFREYLISLKNQVDLALKKIDFSFTNTVTEEKAATSTNNSLESQQLLGRQHLPSQVESQAKDYNLILNAIYGIQPHHLLAKNENSIVNQCFQILSVPLWHLCAYPESLLWSSHFMVELRRQ